MSGRENFFSDGGYFGHLISPTLRSRSLSWKIFLRDWLHWLRRWGRALLNFRCSVCSSPAFIAKQGEAQVVFFKFVGVYHIFINVLALRSPCASPSVEVIYYFNRLYGFLSTFFFPSFSLLCSLSLYFFLRSKLSLLPSGFDFGG